LKGLIHICEACIVIFKLHLNTVAVLYLCLYFIFDWFWYHFNLF